MNQGFSLLELLIVLAMIVILSCVATISYAAYIGCAQRHQAEVVLTKLCAKLEVYASEHDNSYKTATLKKLGLGSLDSGLHYTIRFSQLSTDQFTLEAIPTAAQSGMDPHCGTLTVDEVNQKNVLNVGTVEKCWK